jgi:hypothetical protein
MAYFDYLILLKVWLFIFAYPRSHGFEKPLEIDDVGCTIIAASVFQVN